MQRVLTVAMAVEPLYNDKATLIQKLRMTDTEDTDTLTIIDQAISDVRLNFYRRLSPARAQEIADLSSVENPTTTDEILRNVAEVTEIYWVMHKLVCILPTMYIETQFAIQDSFDDVPITRDADTLQKFMKCLWDSIEEGLGQMMLPIEDNVGGFKSFSTGAIRPFLLSENFVGIKHGCNF